MSRLPVVEVFGPVLEGEGPLAGQPTTFTRLGYCDSRCTWCDSMHSVDPKLVKQNARMFSQQELFELLMSTSGSYPWITYSGGNPVMHDLTELTARLRTAGKLIKVETQGTLWANWLRDTHLIILSPKPPSAGQYRAANAMSEVDFYHRWLSYSIGGPTADLKVKIVVFDEADLKYAVQFAEQCKLDKLWLSCGTDLWDTRDSLGDRYAWLGEAALDAFAGARTQITVLPQLHVVAYLHRQGV